MAKPPRHTPHQNDRTWQMANGPARHLPPAPPTPGRRPQNGAHTLWRVDDFVEIVTNGWRYGRSGGWWVRPGRQVDGWSEFGGSADSCCFGRLEGLGTAGGLWTALILCFDHGLKVGPTGWSTALQRAGRWTVTQILWFPLLVYFIYMIFLFLFYF